MAIQEGTNSGVKDQEAKKRATSLRVKVVDNSKDGRPAVNIKMPIGVVKFGMKMAQTFSPEVKNEAEHNTIEVWVE